MANKKTNKEYFAEVKRVLEENNRADLATFIQGRIDLLDKKADNKKPTKTQEENVITTEKIVAYLGTVEKATATEIMNAVEEVTSPQKAVALVKALIPDKVEKIADKKKVYYKLVAVTEE